MFVARRRVWTLVGLVVVLFGVFSIVALRSRTPGCTAPPPAPALDPRLKALGGFDQPIDAGRQDQLNDAAQRAAAAIGVDLSGVIAERAVPVTAEPPARSDALVVPLTRRTSDQSGARVVGLVAFYRDCSGQAHFGGVDDVAHNASTTTLPLSFPLITSTTARQRLGVTAAPDLVYSESVYAPVWRDLLSGKTTPAT